jgi:enoyl-CoA hydratase/carnithine racemase
VSGLEVTRAGGRCDIVLRRPEVGNVVDVATMRELIGALEQARDDVVVVVSGEGPDFSLGRDQSDRPPGLSKRDNLGLIVECNRRLADVAGIVVAAVRGRALGFGAGLTAQADLGIAAATAQLGFDEMHHGFPPAIVMTYLADIVGTKVATDLLLTGRRVSAAEALQMGLVNRVVDDDVLDAAVESVAAGLLAFDPDAVKRGKRYLRELAALNPSERAERALDLLAGGP